jgi:hypothetical protein
MSIRKYTVVIYALIACCVPGFVAQAYGQPDDEMLLTDAKLWKANDTVRGKIDYINQYNLQFSVTLTDTSGNVIKYYSPKELDGFSILLQKEEMVFRSIENPYDIGRVFLMLIYEGTFSVYLYLELNQRSSFISFVPYYYIWKDGWVEPPITVAHEKEALLMHFSDCPELEYKIKNGEYGLTSIIKIIEEYQDCQLTDDYEFFYE